MGIFRRNEKTEILGDTKQWRMTRRCLELIFECAKDSHPHEFGALLKTSEVMPNTIDEVVLLPGTVSGNRHAIFRMHMKPIDYSIIGTVHSHPSPSNRPSDADLMMFSKYGQVNIIVAYPYGMDTWKAYDKDGDGLILEIV